MVLKQAVGRADGAQLPTSGRPFLRYRSSYAFAFVDGLAVFAATSVASGPDLEALFAALIAVGLIVGHGLDRPRLTLSALDDAPRLSAAVLSATVLTAAFGGDGLTAGATGGALFAVVAVVVGRISTYSAVRAARRRKWVQHRTLVVGAGFTGLEIVELLREHHEYGLQPIAYYDPAPLPGISRPVPVLGGITSVADAIAAAEADVVIVAFGSIPERKMVGILRACDRLRTEIFLIPRLYELYDRHGHQVDSIWGIPVVRLPRCSHRSLAWPLKRGFDLVVSLVLLLALLPVFLACAIAVRLTSGPGVLFRQERVGLDGRHFEIIKFRTMVPTADHDPEVSWTGAGTASTTRVGEVLRRSSLDELPQLWNVLKGEMSLVGPRPERPHWVGAFTEEYPAYQYRHRVPCGMTGLAQVHGLRGDTSIEIRVRFDNAYVESWSVWTDLKILALTALAVVTGKGR
ncbi:MAG: sugar transferase [Actinomycetia bacterium]|nr:sugar transferase [Actinomycetes bacterium]